MNTIQELLYNTENLYSHMLNGSIYLYNKTTKEISIYSNSNLNSFILKTNKKGLDLLSRHTAKLLKDIYKKHE